MKVTTLPEREVKKPSMMSPSVKSKYLVASPIQVDHGELIGRLPRDIPVNDLKELGGPTSPLKAIRAKCIDCSNYDRTEVRKCIAANCPLWPFRMGKNPFDSRAVFNPAAECGQTEETGNVLCSGRQAQET
jgi:hypothetical protein